MFFKDVKLHELAVPVLEEHFPGSKFEVLQVVNEKVNNNFTSQFFNQYYFYCFATWW